MTPGEDWVSLQVPANLAEKLKSYVACSKPNVGWCLLCGCAIESETDFIPNTTTHNCPEGLRLHESLC